jgi:hypothetical protein
MSNDCTNDVLRTIKKTSNVITQQPLTNPIMTN